MKFYKRKKESMKGENQVRLILGGERNWALGRQWQSVVNAVLRDLRILPLAQDVI